MNGKQIQLINNITDNNCQLNISNLNASIYFVRIITENNAVLTQKIIKKYVFNVKREKQIIYRERIYYSS